MFLPRIPTQNVKRLSNFELTSNFSAREEAGPFGFSAVMRFKGKEASVSGFSSFSCFGILLAPRLIL
jgi:hypothetical protein